MGWFHKTLNDMLEAVDREDWDEVRKIVDEHFPLEYDMERDMRRASSLLGEYEQKMSVVRSSVRDAAKRPKDPVGGQVWDIKGCITNARDSMFKFEKIMKKLIAEGKFEE